MVFSLLRYKRFINRISLLDKQRDFYEQGADEDRIGGIRAVLVQVGSDGFCINEGGGYVIDTLLLFSLLCQLR